MDGGVVHPVSKGTKEIEEILDSASAAVDEFAALGSGELNIVKLLQLSIKLAPLAKVAIDGAKEVPAEFKDMDAEEAARVAGKSFVLVQKVIALFK